MMEKISHTEYGGERPLFAAHDLRLEQVTFLPGESALKECRGIVAERCEFRGKYPFWHNDGLSLQDCVFGEGARAAVWYSRNVRMRDTRVEAPKMFREIENLRLENVRLLNAQETFWHCRDVSLKHVRVENGGYLFLHSRNIRLEDYVQQGDYSFQYCRNAEIRNAVIRSKDAFWNTEDVAVYDSVIQGEYLGWYSRRLRLVNCRISGTQPLCYAEDLVLENCTMGPDCDLAFEHSTVRATIDGPLRSVKNPRSGSVTAESYGEIILDGHAKAPADCRIGMRCGPSRCA